MTIRQDVIHLGIAMSNPKPTTLTELLKAGLADRFREVSLRQIGRETGIPQPVLSRFLSGGRALSLRHAETLCAYLGIVHTMRPPKSRRARPSERG